MKVSLSWAKEFTAIDLPVDELVDKIGAQLGAVEEVIDLGARYEGILIVKVRESTKHPNADKLSLCLVDDGGTNKKVKRDKNGLIEIVCGAPNVQAGQLAVWIPPGVVVPSTLDKEPFVIESREIRGVISHGMLASPKELGLGDSHEGILVLENSRLGASFAQALGLDDYIIDIENKMFTHRPDCFGMLGVARELAGILQQPFKSPDWYRENASLPADGRKNVLKLAVKNRVPRLVPRFCAVAIKDIKVGPSPVWLQTRLSSVGVRPVNNIVDITNFLMLETGQPLHAYDYDKVQTGVLGIRLSKKGEQLKLLGGKEIKLDDGAVVITDGQKPIGLGGIMGGADTEVGSSTKNIILECANFDMNLTRKTAMAYGLFTDAATRFTKNQSSRQNRGVIVRAANDILKTAGGRVASPVIDEKTTAISDSKPVKVDADFINLRLGTQLSAAEMKRILENVECGVKQTGDSLNVTAPFWRTDIEIPEDIVEEIGRLYGYDKLPLALPRRNLKPANVNKLLQFKSRLRDILVQAGANEVLTYSFVHGSLLQKTDQVPQDAYRIANALSPDLQYYRLSLTPSLLEKVYPNIRAGIDEFALFEIGKGHNQKMKDKAGLPVEFEMLSAVVVSRVKSAKINGSPYYRARQILDYLAGEIGIKFDYKPIAEEEAYPVVKPFDYLRSAQVWDAATKTPMGMVGEYKQSIIRNLKLPAYSAGFEIGIEQLLQITPGHSQYRPLSRFPELEQDFCLRSSTNLNYQQLTDFITKKLKKLSGQHGYQFRLEPIDIFQREDDKIHKQTTWHIVLSHPERTLTTDESNKLLDDLANLAKKELKAERI
jgi:phenylalanyl-tRNA synthetase beta chain